MVDSTPSVGNGRTLARCFERRRDGGFHHRSASSPRRQGGRPFLPAYDTPAIVEGHTIFAKSVRHPDEGGALLNLTESQSGGLEDSLVARR